MCVCVCVCWCWKLYCIRVRETIARLKEIKSVCVKRIQCRFVLCFVRYYLKTRKATAKNSIRYWSCLVLHLSKPCIIMQFFFQFISIFFFHFFVLFCCAYFLSFFRISFSCLNTMHTHAYTYLQMCMYINNLYAD